MEESAIQAAVNQASPAARLTALQSWRQNVLLGMLTVGAIGAPAIVVVSVLLRSEPYSWLRVVALMVSGLAFPVLRLAPGLPATLRAWAALALSFTTGVVALTTFGFSSGPGIVLAGTCLLAVVFLGRIWGFAMIVLSVGAFLAVGALSARGAIVIHEVELDPGQMRNWIRIGITFALLSTLLTTAIDFVIRHVERSSRAAEEALIDLRHAYERLAQLHERFDAAKEEERRFIAHELHDDLGQVLTVVKLRLQMGAVGPNDTVTGTNGSIQELVALIDGAVQRVRKISVDLRPPLLDEVGFFPALRAYVDAQSALSGIAIRLDIDEGDDRRLDPGLEIACFRIVQESLTNALRHASPGRIIVRAARRAASISLSIVDDGQGFDSGALDAITAGHLGVMGMEERVRARGGSLRITSRRGAGTVVDVEMPIE